MAKQIRYKAENDIYKQSKVKQSAAKAILRGGKRERECLQKGVERWNATKVANEKFAAFLQPVWGLSIFPPIK